MVMCLNTASEADLVESEEAQRMNGLPDDRGSDTDGNE